MAKRRILVTAGNTWAPIDDVRVLTNVFSGETGLKIALQCAKRGLFVTVILADHRVSLNKYEHKRITIIRAVTFKDFYKTVKKEVKSDKHLAVIHAAAISDFILKRPLAGKITSRRKLKLTFSKAPKIADKIRDWNPNIKLIKFKLESQKNKKSLIKIALRSKRVSHANLIVANNMPTKKKHTFFLIKNKQQVRKVGSKKALAKIVARLLDREL